MHGHLPGPSRGRAVVAATAVLLAAAASPAGADTSPEGDSWSYAPATHQLVAANGGLPFSIQGGYAVTDASGASAVKFTTAPSLATYTGTDFPAPGAQDFTWTAVMSMDKIYGRRSTPNVAQLGLYSTHQVKMQLNKYGVPQCVFNGANGRRILTSTTPSLNDGGEKHVFSCWRQGGTVGVTVDGASTSLAFDVGSIIPPAGTAPTVGNRTSTGGPRDQLFGKFWSLTVSNVPPPAP